MKQGQEHLCQHHQEIRSKKAVIVILLIALLVLTCTSFFFGRYAVSVQDFFQYLLGKLSGRHLVSETVEAVITNIRFPRILGAVFLGAALSMAGASYQGIFRNPMVSPDILGATSGASFGAALGILVSFSAIGIRFMSFGFGILAVGCTYFISRIVGRKENTTLVLVLAGMVISSMFNSFISMIKYVADPYSKLPEITYWLMGSLASVETNELLVTSVPLFVGTVLLMLVRWRLNILAFGDEEAAALGVNTKRLRGLVIICATMITASVISLSGQIGWVGLIIPHLGRMLVGPDYKYLMPVTMLLGSCYLLIVDNLARNLFAIEIPLGILTALMGAPFFVYLLLKGKKGWV